MSEPSPQSTIVPPFMNEHWRRLRAHLLDAGDACSEAAGNSTTEHVRPLISNALNSLMDASLQLALIERDGDDAILEEEL